MTSDIRADFLFLVQTYVLTEIATSKMKVEAAAMALAVEPTCLHHRTLISQVEEFVRWRYGFTGKPTWAIINAEFSPGGVTE
mgnify:CR=1 FL=1